MSNQKRRPTWIIRATFPGLSTGWVSEPDGDIGEDLTRARFYVTEGGAKRACGHLQRIGAETDIVPANLQITLKT